MTRAVDLKVSLHSSKWFIFIIILARRATVDSQDDIWINFLPLDSYTETLNCAMANNEIRTLQPLCLFSLPIPPEEPLTTWQGTPITDLIPPCFTYASDVKSPGLGQAHLVLHAAGIRVEISQVCCIVTNTSWSCCRDLSSACSHKFCHTIPLFIASRADLGPYQASWDLYQQTALAPLWCSSSMLELFFHSEKGASHQVSADQVLNWSFHGQKSPEKSQNVSDYPSLSIDISAFYQKGWGTHCDTDTSASHPNS